MSSIKKHSFHIVENPGAVQLNAEDRAELVNALKDKLQDLACNKRSDALESLPSNVRKRVDTLRDLQSQHDDLEAKYFEERAALEDKYQKLYEPFYTKRFEIVNAVVEVEGVPTAADTEEKGVPDFWLNAMKNNEVLSGEISKRDEGALKFLKEIKWLRVDDPKGFKLEFYFEINPYFENRVLTKTYHMIDEVEPILEKTIGTEIQWYPRKKLTEKIVVRKPKRSNSTKPIISSSECDSFFNFFSPPQVPDEEDYIMEADADELQTMMEQDYGIGSTIRDKIIPHAVSWFTGEAAQDEYGDIEDDEDLNEENDDDDDEDESNTRKKTGERPPECKLD